MTSIETNWQSSGPGHDVGNGALRHRSTSADYPGVVRIEFCSYCGREADKTWYEAQGDSQRVEFRSPTKAAEHFRKLQSTARLEAENAELKRQLARR